MEILIWRHRWGFQKFQWVFLWHHAPTSKKHVDVEHQHFVYSHSKHFFLIILVEWIFLSQPCYVILFYRTPISNIASTLFLITIHSFVGFIALGTKAFIKIKKYIFQSKWSNIYKLFFKIKFYMSNYFKIML